MILMLSFVTVASVDASAETQSGKQRLTDYADILTDSEEEALSKLLDKISEKREQRYLMKVKIIITVKKKRLRLQRPLQIPFMTRTALDTGKTVTA